MRLKAGTVVLRTAKGATQVGLAPGIVLTGLNPAQQHALESCESQAHISPSRQALLGASLTELTRGGLVVEAPPPSSGSVCVDDAGPVGLWIARIFVSIGWEVCLADNRPASSAPPDTYASHDCSTRQGAAHATLLQEARQNDGTVRLGHRAGQISVLVNHGIAALDEAIPLMAGDAPHVFVTTDETGVTIGPLVTPGLSACGNCWELRHKRSQGDATAYAVQLLGRARRAPYATPAHAAIAAGVLASVVQCWARDSAEAVNTVWRVEGTNVTAHRVTANPHCGCGAAGGIGDDLTARRAAFP